MCCRSSPTVKVQNVRGRRHGEAEALVGPQRRGIGQLGADAKVGRLLKVLLDGPGQRAGDAASAAGLVHGHEVDALVERARQNAAAQRAK